MKSSKPKVTVFGKNVPISPKALNYVYPRLSLLILFVSTTFWATLGARVQQHNADQLINVQLFENFHTFSNASLPSAHTFLFKWPLFYAVKLLGSSNAALIAITVLVVWATVAIFTYILYRIENRPLVFGTIILALSSVLLLVPTTPYPGALIPVSMAMLATRNLEYMLFITSMILLIKQRSVKSKELWISLILLTTLVASDKLFLTYAIGGGLIALVVYGRASKWKLAKLSADWLILGVIAGICATIVLALINRIGLTSILGQTTTPYGIIHTVSDFVVGSFFAIFGLFTNLGANPIYGTTIIRNVPHDLLHNILQFSSLGYLVNGLLLVFGLFAVYKLLRVSFDTKAVHRAETRISFLLSVLMIATALLALISFVFTKHYYSADARYLTICLFALFIVGATYLRGLNISQDRLLSSGLIILVAIIAGFVGSNQAYHSDQTALEPINQRNQSVSDVLKNHNVSTLVGDYWRVVPVKNISGNQTKVTPLADCTQPRLALSSAAWNTNLNKNSFAYLITLDKRNLTDYPNCTLEQITKHYGKPNASVLISGTLEKPGESLLFYDHGVKNSAPKITTRSPNAATVIPIQPEELANTSCPVPTSMNIVAHQDDDLLFMNPDVLHDINMNHCVRTIYLTAGDAGNGKFYYLSREQGAEAAYSKMIGKNVVWIQRIVKIDDSHYITVANPKGNSKISLIFLNLPDGNLKGDGFKSSNDQSLAKLHAGSIKVMNTLDNQSRYTSPQIVNVLSEIMHIYQPAKIRTQAANAGSKYPDHSDHVNAGLFAKMAYKQYEYEQFANQVTIPISYYMGYPSHERPENLSGQDLKDKQMAFLAYAKYDNGVCATLKQCEDTPTYGAYLSRQYQYDR